MKSGVDLIAEERERQLVQEGFGADHDDSHQEGELAGAAACYALWNAGYIGRFCWRLVMMLWPWDQDSWKPGQGSSYTENRTRDLARAGALIAAEIDRVQRAAVGNLIIKP